MGKGVEFWKPHVAASGSGGAEVISYAREHGLNLSTLRWWRSKLRSDAKIAHASSSRFVAVRVTEAVEHRAAGVTLRIGDHVRIELAAMPSPQWLAMLGKALDEVG